MTLVLQHEGMGRNYHVTEFDSYAMIEALAQPAYEKNSPLMPNIDYCQSAYNMGVPEIKKMFTEGWPDGADIALAMADS